MKLRGLIAVVMMASVLALPCRAIAGQELVVSAAASLTDAFRDIGSAFEADNPGCRVVFNIASSGALLQQMENGAPVDVFASADMHTMEQAQDNALVVKDSVTVFASNSLVLIVPSDSHANIKGPNGLLQAQVTRIAAGNPRTVPAGRYAKEALELSGVWDRVGGKLIMAENVRQVLDYVRRGEVDAGLVYATDAVSAGGAVRTVTGLRTSSPIQYPAAVAEGCRDKMLARRFVVYLSGGRAAAILRKYGFTGESAAR